MVLAQKKIYNILLLGQTGSGKSTFINSFFNYISFENINDLLTPESNVKYCVPTFFEWNDPCSDEDKQYRVALGKHEEDNERQQIGSSGTQDVRCYLFNIGNIGIRLIDSPGFGDTLGERKDEDISENLLQFLTIHEDIRELHAILFVFKPQDSKMTVFFQYCMNHILSKLHKSASGNICFLFTHTKATDYKPGPTSALIKNKIDELQDVNILFEKINKFCVEDDCFHYISAYYYNTYGLNFDDDTKSYFILPWKKSSKECIRLIEYVKTLTPHAVKDSIAINKIAIHNRKLQAILPRIVTLIDEETAECERLEREMSKCALDMQKLKNSLYKYTAIKREGYNVVCRNPKCPKRENDQSTVTCCEQCTAWNLSLCTQISMFKSTCKSCGCNELDHVLTKAEAEVRAEKNPDIESGIEDRQKDFNRFKLLQLEQVIKKMKYQAEKKYIEDCMEKLLQYLERTAIFSNQQNRERFRNDAESLDEIGTKIAEMTNKLTTLHMTGAQIQEAFREEQIVARNERTYYISPVPNNWKRVCEVEDV